MTDPNAAHEAAQTLRDTAQNAVGATPQQTRKTAEQVSKKWFARGVAAATAIAVVFAAVSVVIALYAVRGNAETAAGLGALRQLAQQAYSNGQRANGQLTARGQTPVPIPAPGQADDTDVIVAAATARVLANLPEVRPSAAELGKGIAEYFQAHPVTPMGPTPTQIAADLAGYFTTHPPPSGPAGPTGVAGPSGVPGQPGQNGTNGQDGHTPTEAEIQADFQDYLSQHPEALCPQGGVFSFVTGLGTTDGTSYSGWLCVVSSTPPPVPPPTTTDPATVPLLPIPT